MWAEWLLLLILLDGFTRLGWFPHMLALISFPLKNSRRTFCRSSEHFLCSSVLILCPLSFKSICSLYSQLHIFNSASAEGQRHTTGSEATRTDMVSDHPLEHQPPLWLLPRPWHPSSLPDSLSYGLEVPASDMETTYSQRLLNRLPQLCRAPSSNNPLTPILLCIFTLFTMGSTSLVEHRLTLLEFLNELCLLPGMGIGQIVCGAWLGGVRAGTSNAQEACIKR